MLSETLHVYFVVVLQLTQEQKKQGEDEEGLDICVMCELTDSRLHYVE